MRKGDIVCRATLMMEDLIKQNILLQSLLELSNTKVDLLELQSEVKLREFRNIMTELEEKTVQNEQLGSKLLEFRNRIIELEKEKTTRIEDHDANIKNLRDHINEICKRNGNLIEENKELKEVINDLRSSHSSINGQVQEAYPNMIFTFDDRNYPRDEQLVNRSNNNELESFLDLGNLVDRNHIQVLGEFGPITMKDLTR